MQHKCILQKHILDRVSRVGFLDADIRRETSQLIHRSPTTPNSGNIDQTPCGNAIDRLFAGVCVHAIARGVKLNWVPAG